MLPRDFDAQVRKAVKHFWLTRKGQSERQAARGRVRDYGARSAVTGGAQMDGFAQLITKLLLKAGVPDSAIFTRTAVELPGYYRPTKKWDLLVVNEGTLVAAMEFKSQVGPSFGNNFNNRSEEAIGSASDILAAFREGAFRPSPKPWLGYMMLLEKTAGSTASVGVAEPHFKVFDEFRDASYQRRYELLCLRLVRERLYDAAAFVTSTEAGGRRGRFEEPGTELSVRRFTTSLFAHATSALQRPKTG